MSDIKSSNLLISLTIISLIFMLSFLTVLFIDQIIFPAKVSYPYCGGPIISNYPWIFYYIILPIGLIGLILGIIVVVHPGSTYKIKTMMKISIALAILLSIAIPNFIRYQAKPKRCEVKGNLYDFYKKEKKKYSKNGIYATTFQELGWKPKDNFRYCYQLSETEVIKPPTDANCTLPPGIKPFVSKDRFLIVAVGNIDNDTTLDVWSIDEKGNLKNLVDDVKN